MTEAAQAGGVGADAAPEGLPPSGAEGIAPGRTFEPVFFDRDSTELRYATRRALHEYVQWLNEHPEVRLRLDGHSEAWGTTEFNYALGMARAWAVRDRLVGLGLEADRLETFSFGEERPLSEGVYPSEPYPNARVEFRAYLAGPAPDRAEPMPAPRVRPPIRRPEDPELPSDLRPPSPR